MGLDNILFEISKPTLAAVGAVLLALVANILKKKKKKEEEKPFLKKKYKIYQALVESFPDVDIQFKAKLSDSYKTALDIYIPDYHLAFELMDSNYSIKYKGLYNAELGHHKSLLDKARYCYFYARKAYGKEIVFSIVGMEEKTINSRVVQLNNNNNIYEICSLRKVPNGQHYSDIKRVYLSIHDRLREEMNRVDSEKYNEYLTNNFQSIMSILDSDLSLKDMYKLKGQEAISVLYDDET